LLRTSRSLVLAVSKLSLVNCITRIINARGHD
jgi:hypothetical protein